MADLLYGINPVVEALRGSRREVLELLLQDDVRSPRVDELQQMAREHKVPVRLCRRQELDKMAGHNRHQGAVLKVAPFPYIDLDDLLDSGRRDGRPPFLLILDGITDPHNFGAILRSADAAGCHGVIVAKDRACPVSGVVEKTAAGALAHLPLCQVTNLARTMERLKEEGIWLYGLAGEEGASTLYDVDLTSGLAIVVGSEGNGLRPVVRKQCDLLLAIPMAGGVASLNASVAVAVALFETVRQRTP